GAEGGGGGAELVGGEDPAEEQADVPAAEQVGGEADGRWHGGDPVQAVEDDEEAEAEKAGAVGVGEEQEGEAAQAVVPGEEPAAVEAVGEPAGDEGADDVEEADQGEE